MFNLSGWVSEYKFKFHMARTGAWCKKLIGELHPYIESLD